MNLPGNLGTLSKDRIAPEQPMKLSLMAFGWCVAIMPSSTVAQSTLQDLADGFGLPLGTSGQAALETGIDVLSGALANALQRSRDQARQAGTLPIPPHIRAALLTQYPPGLLDGIEYRVGVAEEATVQSYSIRFGDALAVATIDTITFATAFDATNNLGVWAHEVTHVQQFRAWGLDEFARRYVVDHASVESEAYAEAAAFRAAYDRGGWRYADIADLPFAAPAAPALVCATPEGACVMGVPLAVGSSCTCPSDSGAVWGLSQ